MHGPMLHAVEVEAEIATIYRAITTQEGEASFWTPDCDVQAIIGSVARFGFATAPVDLRMRIDGLAEGRSVRWTCLGDFPHWAGTTVEWDLEPAPSGRGTMVRFRHDGWSAEYPESDYA